jgi:hypothetical protein
VFPKDKAGFEIDDQFFIGSSGLLVKPVTEKGVTETSVYLPESQVTVSAFLGNHLLTLFPRYITTISPTMPIAEQQRASK